MCYETLQDYDILGELGYKVPFVINPSYKNKYVKYLLHMDITGCLTYGYFYVDDNMQLQELDSDIGI